jgi:hypothetical protein
LGGIACSDQSDHSIISIRPADEWRYKVPDVPRSLQFSVARQITATHCLPTTDRRSIFSDRLGCCTVMPRRRGMAILARSRRFARPLLKAFRRPISSRGKAATTPDFRLWPPADLAIPSGFGGLRTVRDHALCPSASGLFEYSAFGSGMYLARWPRVEPLGHTGFLLPIMPIPRTNVLVPINVNGRARPWPQRRRRAGYSGGPHGSAYRGTPAECEGGRRRDQHSRF